MSYIYFCNSLKQVLYKIVSYLETFAMPKKIISKILELIHSAHQNQL